MKPFSLILIVKNRPQQLMNVLESVSLSTMRPNDIHVVAMDDIPYSSSYITDGSLFVHRLKSSGTLPLAKARNTGAQHAKTDILVFLDVDCIVSPTLFETMLHRLDSKTVVTAYPRYLKMLPDHGKYNHLTKNAVTHPGRESIAENVPAIHTKFWSLVYAINSATYQEIGGFDESFVGYGGEDTDFAQSFHRADISLIFVKDYVLHQYHTKYDPPLNYFENIIVNARRYKEKWGTYPMTAWLDAFKKLGLITYEDNIMIKRYPSEKEISDAISHHPY